MKDYYEILGIPFNSSQEDIKRAYRILAHQYHPDKNNGNEKRFKEINEAYRILSYSKTKQEYDLNYTASKTNRKYSEQEDEEKETKEKYRNDYSNKETEKEVNFYFWGQILNIKKTTLINICLVVLFFFVISLIVGGILTSVKNSNPFLNVDSNDLSMTDSPWKTVVLGDRNVDDGGFTFSSSSTNFGKYFGDTNWAISDRNTEGAFWGVKLTVNNQTLSTSSITLGNFKIIDQSGRQYYPSYMKSCDSNFTSFYIEPKLLILKPDIPCTVKLLFEVSENSERYNFQFDYR